MKDTLYIAVTGVHGSGKTTLCGKLADAIREMGLDVGVGEEVARNCPHPVSLDTTREAQDWIYRNHLAMEGILRNAGHDVVIFDRTLLDNTLYALRMVGKKGLKIDERLSADMEFAVDRLKRLEYDLVIRTHHFPELLLTESLRNRSEEHAFAREIESIFDVFMSPFVDIDVADVRNSNVIQTTVKWVEENL